MRHPFLPETRLLQRPTPLSLPHPEISPQHTNPSQLFNGRFPRLPATAVLPHMLLPSSLVSLKGLDLRATHKLDHVVRLPLLEAKASALVGVILVVRLVFVVFDLDEVGVDGCGVEGEGDERVDGGGFDGREEGP